MINTHSMARAPFTLIAGAVETTSVLEELQAATELWLADTSRQRKVRCQRHTRNIFLRCPRKPLPPGARNANDVHESRASRHASRFPRTLELVEALAEAEGGVPGRATIVALAPRRRVYPHVDAGDYYRIRDRYHLVLRSPAGSPLTVAGETVTMRERQLWVINNKVRHAADNPSDTVRIHLIFDLLPRAGAGHYTDPRPMPDASGPREAAGGRISGPRTASDAGP